MNGNDNALLEYYADVQRKIGAYADPLPPLPLTPDDLLPLARAKYEAQIETLGVSALPIILDRNIDDSDEKVQLVDPKTSVVPPPQGVGNYFTVSEYSHRWDAAYAQATSVTDADLAKMTPITDARLLKAVEMLSARFGLTPVPKLVYSGKEDVDSPDYANVTVSGVRFIALKPEDSVESQLTTLAHEIGHHALGQLDYPTIAYNHNMAGTDPARAVMESRSQETAADMFYVYVGRATEAIDDFRRDLKRDRATVEGEGKVYDQQYQRTNDPLHPTLEERIHMIAIEDKSLRAAGTVLPFEVMAGLKTLTDPKTAATNGPPASVPAKPATRDTALPQK